MLFTQITNGVDECGKNPRVDLFTQGDFIKLYLASRAILKRARWLDLLLKACHKDKNIVLGNKTVFLEQGSLITSEVKLADEWEWSRAKVRAFLELLESEEMITKKTTNKYTEINIVNYKVYQDFENIKEQEKNS